MQRPVSMWTFKTADAHSDTRVVFTQHWGDENFSQVISSLVLNLTSCVSSTYTWRPVWLWLQILNKFEYWTKTLTMIRWGAQSYKGISNTSRDYHTLPIKVCPTGLRFKTPVITQYSGQWDQLFFLPSLYCMALPPSDASSSADVNECTDDIRGVSADFTR